MSIRAVADTHTIIWYMHQNKSLSMTAQTFIEKTYLEGDQIAISTMTLIEIVYLAEKGRIDSSSLNTLVSVLEQPSSGMIEIPIERMVVSAMENIPKSQIPEMPDRVISATAMYLEVPLITRDHKIQKSLVPTIW